MVVSKDNQLRQINDLVDFSIIDSLIGFKNISFSVASAITDAFLVVEISVIVNVFFFFVLLKRTRYYSDHAFCFLSAGHTCPHDYSSFWPSRKCVTSS